MQKTLRQPKAKQFTGAFIRLPSGQYARYPNPVKAKCMVLDKALHETLITSQSDLQKWDRDHLVTIYSSLGLQAPKRITAPALWQALQERSEDRCSIYQQGKRAVARSNPDGYTITQTFKEKENPEVKEITEDWINAQRIPRQARACFLILWRWCKANSTWSMSEDQARKLITANKDLLNTDQLPWRVFQYYRRDWLIKQNLLKMNS